MKAIFAVSALAAAISAQALAADTEFTTKANGAMDVIWTYDLAADEKAHDVSKNEDDFNYGLKYTVNVKNGPFSGDLYFEAKDYAGKLATKTSTESIDHDNDATTDEIDVVTSSSIDSDKLKIEVKNLKVTEGKVSFGQVGKLKDTDKYLKVVEDMNETAAGVDAAFRVQVTDELKVQLQGKESETATGLAAQYKGSADALSYVAEVEATIVDGADDTDTRIGFGATYKADAYTVKAAVNSTADAGVTTTEYGVHAEVKVAGATVKAGYLELGADTDDDEYALVEVSYAAGSITPSAGYEYKSVDGGDKLWGKVAYSQDMIGASAKVSVADFDADEAQALKIELEATKKTESGITYYAKFANQAEKTVKTVAINGETNKLTLGAKYKF